MRETTLTELRNHARTDIVPAEVAMPAWKKPPRTRLSLGSLRLSDEVVADRDQRVASTLPWRNRL